MSGRHARGRDEDLPETEREIDAFFRGRSSVQRTLQRRVHALEDVKVDFALGSQVG